MQTGEQAGPYVIERFLDEGGMAEVFAVRHTVNGTRHAMKVLALDDDEARKRVLQEGKAMAGFSHPNLVTVTDTVDVGGSPGLIMELIEGPSLDEWMNDVPTTFEQRIEVFRGIAEGVAEAHRHGLVHRDLQPANVLIAQTPAGWQPKIIDFGVAMHLKEAADYRTQTGSLFGTLGYMAPEQLEGAGGVDRRADVFSLGCLLYLLACFAEPFEDVDEMKLIAAIEEVRHKPPQAHAPDLPAAIIAAIEGSLQRNRRHRIPDADTLLLVLDGLPWPPDDDDEGEETVVMSADEMLALRRDGKD